jgi:hypothetical protein
MTSGIGFVSETGHRNRTESFRASAEAAGAALDADRDRVAIHGRGAHVECQQESRRSRPGPPARGARRWAASGLLLGQAESGFAEIGQLRIAASAPAKAVRALSWPQVTQKNDAHRGMTAAADLAGRALRRHGHTFRPN